MEVTVIIDNHSLDKKLNPEMGFCAYIEVSGTKVLFDTGETENLIKNAKKLNVDLFDIDYIVFSHGHHDHTNGLCYLLDLYKRKNISKKDRPKIIAHPDVFLPKYDGDLYIGTKLSKEEIEDNFHVLYSKSPKQITDNLLFLGEIPRMNNFESQTSFCEVLKEGKIEGDFLLDDTAVVYKSKKGLVVIAGCSHSGICNILDYAIKNTGIQKVHAVIGGLHLIDSSEDFIDQTIDHLKTLDIHELSPCHCTGSRAINKIKKSLPLTEDIGCGFQKVYA